MLNHLYMMSSLSINIEEIQDDYSYLISLQCKVLVVGVKKPATDSRSGIRRQRHQSVMSALLQQDQTFVVTVVCGRELDLLVYPLCLECHHFLPRGDHKRRAQASTIMVRPRQIPRGLCRSVDHLLDRPLPIGTAQCRRLLAALAQRGRQGLV